MPTTPDEHSGGLAARLLGWLRGLFGGGEIEPVIADHRAFTAAAFGKHPAYDDFMPDLADRPGEPADATLLRLRASLLNGLIAPNIDADAWPDPAPEKPPRLKRFDHVALYRQAVAVDEPSPAPVAALRVVASRDGRGRTKYPLAVSVRATPPTDQDATVAEAERIAFAGTVAIGLIDEQLPELTNAGGGAAISSSLAGLVRQTQSRHDAMSRSHPMAESGDQALGALCRHLGEDRLLPVLYEMGHRLCDYRRNGAATTTPQQAASLRLPAWDADEAEVVRLWTIFLSTEVRRDVDLLVIALADPQQMLPDEPFDGGWVDVVLGTGDGPAGLGLLAPPSRVVRVDTIPFEYDQGWRDEALARLRSVAS